MRPRAPEPQQEIFQQKNAMHYVLPLDGGGAGTEYTMIELQGTLESSVGSLSGQELGSFSCTGDEARLVVGTHELRGHREQLSKALVVTRGTGESLAVLGVVRAKWVFNKRPNTLAVQPIAHVQ
jgi:hypothetical protein